MQGEEQEPEPPPELAATKPEDIALVVNEAVGTWRIVAGHGLESYADWHHLGEDGRAELVDDVRFALRFLNTLTPKDYHASCLARRHEPVAPWATLKPDERRGAMLALGTIRALGQSSGAVEDKAKQGKGRYFI